MAPWVFDAEHQVWSIRGRDCWIWMNARPPYCDRGRWLARLEVLLLAEGLTGPRPELLHIDAQDGWPRYYFDLDRAKLEIEAWLINRRQAIDVAADGMLTAEIFDAFCQQDIGPDS